MYQGTQQHWVNTLLCAGFCSGTFQCTYVYGVCWTDLICGGTGRENLTMVFFCRLFMPLCYP